MASVIQPTIRASKRHKKERRKCKRKGEKKREKQQLKARCQTKNMKNMRGRRDALTEKKRQGRAGQAWGETGASSIWRTVRTANKGIIFISKYTIPDRGNH